jgi:hypothetical protein
VTVGAEVIGWQAKFIDIELAKYKAKLIDAIDKATAQHLSLTQLYFYLNVDFGRGRKSGAKDPTYKTEIEDYAKAKGVAITWKTASFFETPFVCETNAHIAKHFFALGASVIDFVQDIARHTDAVLEPIRSAITVEGDSIKIDRRPLVARLKDTLSRSALVIVSGEGGVGKTAVIKDFYDEVRGNIPFFVFKATEFNVSHINQFFKEYGGFTFSNFIHEHDDFGEKYVVVDSAEKGFFARVARDIGNHPAVLYSLAKLLNEIGAPFAADGVFWISGILESHPTLSDEDFEASTAYYLENLIRGYVLRNREKARTTPQIKAAVLRILNFLLEKGSVTAYLTREYIL